MTTDEFVSKAKHLRQIADQAEHDYLEFLLWGETQEEIWQGSGSDYTSFLSTKNLCQITRYIKYRKIRTGLGLADLKDVGMEAVLQASTFNNIDDQTDLLGEARTWEKTNGTSISDQSAQALARDLKQRKASQSTGHKNYARVVAENEKLRLEIAELRTENMVLRTELKKFKKVKKHAAAPTGQKTDSPK